MTSKILATQIHTLSPEDLTPYPGNARRGNTDLIARSLQNNGQYRPLVVQHSTGHVLAGNHTLAAARELGWEQVAVQYIDVDDTAARKILLADNKTSDEATYDEGLLAQLLTEAHTLDGTGFTDEETDDLLAALEETTPEPQPTPPSGATPEPDQPTQLQSGTRLDDNTTWARSTNDYKSTYNTSHTRQIVLSYQGTDYIRIIDQLHTLALRYNTTTNADTIRAALTHLTEQEEP